MHFSSGSLNSVFIEMQPRIDFPIFHRRPIKIALFTHFQLDPTAEEKKSGRNSCGSLEVRHQGHRGAACAPPTQARRRQDCTRTHTLLSARTRIFCVQAQWWRKTSCEEHVRDRISPKQPSLSTRAQTDRQERILQTESNLLSKCSAYRTIREVDATYAAS